MTEELKGEAQAVADIVRKHIAPELVNVARGLGAGWGPGGSDEVPLLVLPSGLQAHSVKKHLDEYRSRPERRTGTANLVELASFIRHVNRFKDDDSALFGLPDASTPRLLAVFDYHKRCNLPPADDQEPDASVHVDGEPRFGTHRASYTFPLSDEWSAWLASNSKAMVQADFASWLEDRIMDVADPQQAFTAAKRFAEALGVASFASPSRLMQLSRGLTIHVDERVTNRIDPASGETTMHFSQDHSADEQGAPIAIPRAFMIQIPVFREGALYQFPIRLKYRTSGGRVSWSYEIHDPRKAFDHAFREACAHAEEATELPLFYGSPEVGER